MAFLAINPKYGDLLESLGLKRPEDFLALPGVIVGGHPDRHIVRLELPSAKFGCYLKRDHRVRWKERLTSAARGYGLVPKAVREAFLLKQLEAAQISCAEWMATGVAANCQGFLLLREVADAQQLGDRLHRLPAPEQRTLAQSLGRALAAMHQAGFDHPDLYAKHILVRPADGRVVFLDWQRSRRRKQVRWATRERDLAALHATLAEAVASPRLRLACLREYLRCSYASLGVPALAGAARAIDRRANKLLERRRVREMRRQQPGATQHLIWLNGEALCVTPAFGEVLELSSMAWLRERLTHPLHRTGLERARLAVHGGKRWAFRRRYQICPLAWLLAALRRKRLVSPEQQEARILFHLERYGIPAPALLAVGQWQKRLGLTHSFLLTEPLPGWHLVDWLIDGPGRISAPPTPSTRRHALQQLGALLRQLRVAGCRPTSAFFKGGVVVCRDGAAPPRVVIGEAEGLRLIGKQRRRAGFAELVSWGVALARARLTRAEIRCFLGSYFGENPIPRRAVGYFRTGDCFARWVKRWRSQNGLLPVNAPGSQRIVVTSEHPV